MSGKWDGKKDLCWAHSNLIRQLPQQHATAIELFATVSMDSASKAVYLPLEEEDWA